MSERTWRDVIEFPLVYDREGGWIVDNSGQPVLQIRGYGKLTSMLESPEVAEIEQDRFAAWAAHTLNQGMELQGIVPQRYDPSETVEDTVERKR